MVKYSVSSRAYTKMILHAAKYPHCAVNGVLLGNGKDNASTGQKSAIHIEDVFPLFHECLNISPMAEVALIQIEALANKLGLQIAGYYVACEQFYDKSIEKAPGVRIADKIAENYPNALFAIIDNVSISSKEVGPALHVWQNADNRWNPTAFKLEQTDETLDAVEALLQRGAMKDLHDFDNHLDDISKDWTNEHLNKDLTQLLAMY